MLCQSHFGLCAHVYSDVDAPESSCTFFVHVYSVVGVMPEPFWTLCVCAVLWMCQSHFGVFVSVYGAVDVVPKRASLDSVCM